MDASRWAYDIGTGPPFPGWGNNELEYYTSRSQNVVLSNGLLHIIARKENFGGAAYTSARLKTQGRFSTTYGRFEFHARLPTGQGFWPAFWLMPRDSVYGSWAASGEVDIMENRGQDPATVFGTIHFGRVSHQHPVLRAVLQFSVWRLSCQFPRVCPRMDHQFL